MPAKRNEPESFDDLIGQTITALTPNQRDPMRVSVRVGKRSMGVIDRGAISDLGLRKGAVFDESMIRLVRTSSITQAARTNALRLPSAKRTRSKIWLDAVPSCCLRRFTTWSADST